MKKYISMFLCAVLLLCSMTACGSTQTAPTPADSAKLSIVTTIFPEYDWVKQIIGDTDSADITMLLDNNVDLHSYQPTADDMIRISSCDLFIYVGGESDQWVEDALSEATNKDMKVINLLDVLGNSVKEEELIEGMEGEEEEEASDEEGPEYDEHVWLSLRNAQVLCNKISDTLGEIDAAHADQYRTNCASYCEQLQTLDEAYTQAVTEASKDTLLFGDRFPFRYLVDDYHLNYYAAFAGCSAESEASFETIVFLADKLNELCLNSVLQIESADGKIAQTIIDTSASDHCTILTLNSMQSTTSKEAAEGTTYLSIMTQNLDILKEALQ